MPAGESAVPTRLYGSCLTLLGETQTPRSPRFYDQRPWAKATIRRRRSSAPTVAAAAASSLTTSTQRAFAPGVRAAVAADHLCAIREAVSVVVARRSPRTDAR